MFVENVEKREYIWEDHENENVCFGTSNRLEANASRKWDLKKRQKYEISMYISHKIKRYMQIFWNILK